MTAEYWVDVLPEYGNDAIDSIHWLNVSGNYMKSDVERWLKEKYGQRCRVFISSCPQSFGGHRAVPEAYREYSK